jgi:acryloyl-coenzyme A reductase
VRAIVQRQAGGAEVLRLEEIGAPEMRAADVLIRVDTCGVCYHDVVVRNGVFRRGVHMPLVPGHEVAGVVEQVGPATKRLHVGDRVCTVQRRYVCGECRDCRSGHEVNCRYKEFMGDAHLNGGYAELLAVAEDQVALVPARVPLSEAAIVACAIGTQLNAIRDVGNVRIGETVLVTGANGGQGAHGVQIARACGAFVLAVASNQEKAARVRSLGAHEVVVMPHGGDFSADVRALTGGRGVDVVVDNVGTAVYEQVRRSLARHGRWVMVGALTGDKVGFNPAQMFTNDISLLSAVSCTRAQLEDALVLVERGLVRPIVAQHLPLECAAEAHTMLETSSVTGRIVLSIGLAAAASDGDRS